MINVPAVIVAYLLNQPLLTVLTGQRVWAERNDPPSSYTPTQGGAVCFKVRGGTVDYSDALLRPSVQFRCYGRDEVQAQHVYRALYDVLHHRIGTPPVRYAELESAGETLYSPETNPPWPFVLTFFIVELINA